MEKEEEEEEDKALFTAQIVLDDDDGVITIFSPRKVDLRALLLLLIVALMMMLLLLLFLVCCALLLVLGEDKIAPNEEEDTPTSADILKIFYAENVTKDENFFLILLLFIFGTYENLIQHKTNDSLSLFSLSLSLSLSLATSDILLLSFSSVIITSATLPFVLFVSAVVLWVSRRFSSPRISGRRKVSLSSLQPVWTEAAEAFRL